jgi:hypothetical protein
MKQILFAFLLLVTFIGNAQITNITGANPKVVFLQSTSTGDSLFVKDANGQMKLINKSDLGFATQTIASGTYTPAASNLQNISTDTRYSSTMYTRIGNIVTVSGKIQIVPNASGVTGLDLSLPVATANFNDNSQAAGVASYSNGSSTASGKIYANASSQTVKFSYYAPDTAVADFYFIFQYTIQ